MPERKVKSRDGWIVVLLYYADGRHWQCCSCIVRCEHSRLRDIAIETVSMILVGGHGTLDDVGSLVASGEGSSGGGTDSDCDKVSDLSGLPAACSSAESSASSVAADQGMVPEDVSSQSGMESDATTLSLDANSAWRRCCCSIGACVSVCILMFTNSCTGFPSLRNDISNCTYCVASSRNDTQSSRNGFNSDQIDALRYAQGTHKVRVHWFSLICGFQPEIMT